VCSRARRPCYITKAASTFQSKPLFFAHKNACQLEGSDHGGRDTAAELALAGTIDVQVPDGSCNRLTLGPAPSDAGNYTLRDLSVNGFSKSQILRPDLTLWDSISILQSLLLATAR
jgi:hypothetical protein